VRLDGKVALITGGTSGIGEATAVRFAQEGARITITGRDEPRGAAVVARIEGDGGQARFVRGDVRSAQDCERAVAETLEAFGRIDILFNNAGVYVANDTLGCDEDEWDLQVDTSLKGAFLMTRAALPTMLAQRSGAIVHCASDWGLFGGEKAVAYCAAKGGMVVMGKAQAIDLAPHGIRVNIVCPGDTETPMEVEDARQQGMTWDEYVAQAIAGRPIARMGRPEEVASAVLFLASEESSFITGIALSVDGGASAG